VEPTITPPSELTDLLGRVALRLRLRHALRDLVYGSWAGCATGVLLLLLSKFLWLGVPGIVAAGAALAACQLAGLGVGLSRKVLPETGLALLVDKGLGTREQIVSALEASQVVRPDAALSSALVERARLLAGRLDPAEAVPLVRRREMRPLLFLPLGLALLPALMLLPPFTGSAEPRPDGVDEQVVEEGEALEDRLQEIEQEAGEELPEEIREQLAELAEELQNEQLDAEEALQRIEQMQDQLEQFQEDLADKSEAEELQQAAEQLQHSELTQELGEALEVPDFEKAAAAAEKMAQKAAEASAAEQQQAAQALSQAAQQLAESNPELAEKMQQMADQMNQMSQQGQQGQGMTPEQQQALQQMAQQLQQMQQDGLAEQLKQDSASASRSSSDTDAAPDPEYVRRSTAGARRRTGRTSRDGEGLPECSAAPDPCSFHKGGRSASQTARDASDRRPILRPTVCPPARPPIARACIEHRPTPAPGTSA